MRTKMRKRTRVKGRKIPGPEGFTFYVNDDGETRPQLRFRNSAASQSSTKATSVVKHPLSPESPVNQPPVENQTKAVTATVAPVFKTWQHPAAPFCYEPSSTFVPPFVPV
ncbi:BnaC03g74490D [Brassica napus]|nr:unnamed protein product [Brassica napus]CDY52423.1 BnaC03g74490D [Brassica napus]